MPVKMLSKLRNRILLLNLTITSFVILLSFLAIYLITVGSQALNEYTALRNLEDLTSSAALEEWSSSHYEQAFIVAVDSEGRLLDVYSPIDYPHSFYETAAQNAWDSDAAEFDLYHATWRYSFQKVRYQDFSLPKDTVAYTIVFLDVSSDRTTRGSLLFTLGIIGVAMLLAVFFVSRYVAKRAIRPVEDAWEQQRRFVADASHELKTPLMTIMANCDVLEANEEETVKSQREWLESIKLGADRMGRLVTNLLSLARIEAKTLPEQKQDFGLNALIGEVMQSMDGLALAKGLRTSLAPQPEREMTGYPDLVRQVFTILYENAVKYTNEGGLIEVHILSHRKQTTLVIRNTGEGIAASDLPHIFDRFYRADAARTAEDNSYGLGLPIARSVAERIGGQISAQSTPGGWTEFSFSFE